MSGANPAGGGNNATSGRSPSRLANDHLFATVPSPGPSCPDSPRRSLFNLRLIAASAAGLGGPVMQSGSDSSDSRDDSRYDSYDSRERPLPTKKGRALGIVAVCFAVLSFVGLLGCYGCVFRAKVLLGGLGLWLIPLLFFRPQPAIQQPSVELLLLCIIFVVCFLVSLAGTLIGVVTGIISLFGGEANRRLGRGALMTALVWAGGVCVLVRFF